MTTNASYNFKAPAISADADSKVEVVFPTSEKQTVAASATIAVDVERVITVIDLGTLAAAAILNLTVGTDVPVGAILVVKAKSDATGRNITLGTKLEGDTITGIASKTKIASFIFDGSKFIQISSPAIVEGVSVTSEKQAITGASVMPATITLQNTILDLGTLTAAGTLNLTIDAGVQIGALLVVKAKSDTTARDVTLGTGMTGPVFAGTISKTKNVSLMYDGTTFVAMSAAVQLD